MEIILSVLTIILYYKIFTKAGEPGWYSLIPVLNIYTLYQIAWTPFYFWIYLLCTISAVIGIVTNMFLAMLLCCLVCMILNIILYIRLARVFRDGTFYVAALVAIEVIRFLISL
ncbi:MAG: hypothetical protein J6C84_10550 [Lachnospiraceae bacterium]|nr:hypothetical protein [Lachnospiraceae bacterium]